MNGFGEPLGSNLVFALGCAMAALLAGLWRERRAGETAVVRQEPAAGADPEPETKAGGCCGGGKQTEAG